MLNEVLYKCHSCKLYIPQQKTCQLMIQQMQGRIEPDDYCSQHIQDIPICEGCGAAILVPYIQVRGNEAHIYCVNCCAAISAQRANGNS